MKTYRIHGILAHKDPEFLDWLQTRLQPGDDHPEWLLELSNDLQRWASNHSATESWFQGLRALEYDRTAFPECDARSAPTLEAPVIPTSDCALLPALETAANPAFEPPQMRFSIVAPEDFAEAITGTLSCIRTRHNQSTRS